MTLSYLQGLAGGAVCKQSSKVVSVVGVPVQQAFAISAEEISDVTPRALFRP